jgi:hypothetical protein
MAQGSTQPLAEMSIRSLPGGKGWLALKADNLMAICEPLFLENVGASRNPRASIACYRDSFTFYHSNKQHMFEPMSQPSG